MKRKTLLIVTLLSILAMLFTVAAAPAAKGVFHLVDARFVSGKGFVFVFSVSGKVGSLKGSVSTSSNSFSLNCVETDGAHVNCTVNGALAAYQGKPATVSINGQSFATKLPYKFDCKSVTWTSHTNWPDGTTSYWWNYADTLQDAQNLAGLYYEWDGEMSDGNFSCSEEVPPPFGAREVYIHP
jgi:hypothetical protein